MLFTTITWGTILVVCGLLLLVKAVFCIRVPVLQLLFGGLVVYFGIYLTTGFDGKNGSSHTIMVSQETLKPETVAPQYNVLLGQAIIDLSALKPVQETQTVALHTIFGNTTLIVPSDMPVQVIAQATCARVQLPNNSSSSFGSAVYHSHAQQATPLLTIEANTLFGNLHVQKSC